MSKIDECLHVLEMHQFDLKQGQRQKLTELFMILVITLCSLFQLESDPGRNDHTRALWMDYTNETTLKPLRITFS